MTESKLTEPPSISRAFELLRFAGIHQRHTDAIERVTGAKFNIFNILRVGHLELTTHSPILGALLDPKGSHGQGTIFLELFIERFRIKGANPEKHINLDKVIVEVERHIGPVTEISGGRIDILVSDDSGPQFMIENKIYANDQPNQLKRYRSFSKHAFLFYLTLIPEDPQNLKHETMLELDVKSIAYEKDILQWLKDCRKEVACVPVVRELLSQYIMLIEELTHQTASHNMHKELIKEATSEEGFKAFHLLLTLKDPIYDDLFGRLNDVIEKIAIDHGLDRFTHDRNLRVPWGGFGFSNFKLEKLGICIFFESSARDFQNLSFGFALRDNDIPTPFVDQLRKGFSDQFSQCATNKVWPAVLGFEPPYRSWGEEAFVGLLSGDFAENLNQKVVALLEIAQSISEGQDVM
jgi:hypothetical protein